MRRFLITDIHGRYEALEECLESVNFDNYKDQLFVNGDLYDYGNGVCEIIDRLIKVKNKIMMRGNHDMVFRHWLKTGVHLYNWSHCGIGNIQSYSKLIGKEFDLMENMIQLSDIPVYHEIFLDSMVDYHLTSDGLLFCHAGIDIELPLDLQISDEYYQNRSLFKNAKKGILPISSEFDKIFIGHTITDDNLPFITDNVINIDTGAKMIGGKLTIMNIDTLSYNQITVS